MIYFVCKKIYNDYAQRKQRCKMAGKSKNLKNMKSDKNEKADFRSKQIRRNQVIFGFIAVVLILSMLLSQVKF